MIESSVKNEHQKHSVSQLRLLIICANVPTQAYFETDSYQWHQSSLQSFNGRERDDWKLLIKYCLCIVETLVGWEEENSNVTKNGNSTSLPTDPSVVMRSLCPSASSNQMLDSRKTALQLVNRIRTLSVPLRAVCWHAGPLLFANVPWRCAGLVPLTISSVRLFNTSFFTHELNTIDYCGGV